MEGIIMYFELKINEPEYAITVSDFDAQYVEDPDDVECVPLYGSLVVEGVEHPFEISLYDNHIEIVEGDDFFDNAPEVKNRLISEIAYNLLKNILKESRKNKDHSDDEVFT